MGRVSAACVSLVLVGGLALWSQTVSAAPAAPAPANRLETQADLTQPCAKAGDSPVCALKAWIACVLYDANLACTAATDGQVTGQKSARTADKVVTTKPWSVPFARLMPEAFGLEIFDGSTVPVERIAVFGEDANGKSARLPLPDRIPKTGAYEMFIKTMDLDTEGWTFEISILLAREKNAWRVVAWGSTRPRACAFDPRGGRGGGVWGPCRLFMQRLSILGLADNPRLPVWHAPKYTGPIPYPHRGVDVQVNTAGEKIAAPMSGTIARRPRVYLDTDAYDWVVVKGTRGDTPLEMKLAYVSADGPKIGARVNVTTVLGRQQSLTSEFSHMNEFVHWEVVMEGRNVDPTPFRAARGN